jgi:hypothetical protein
VVTLLRVWLLHRSNFIPSGKLSIRLFAGQFRASHRSPQSEIRDRKTGLDGLPARPETIEFEPETRVSRWAHSDLGIVPSLDLRARTGRNLKMGHNVMLLIMLAICAVPVRPALRLPLQTYVDYRVLLRYIVAVSSGLVFRGFTLMHTLPYWPPLDLLPRTVAATAFPQRWQPPDSVARRPKTRVIHRQINSYSGGQLPEVCKPFTQKTRRSKPFLVGFSCEFKLLAVGLLPHPFGSQCASVVATFPKSRFV